jgi:hypothetical protein
MNYPDPRVEGSKISSAATSVSPLEHARGAPGGKYIFLYFVRLANKIQKKRNN